MAKKKQTAWNFARGWREAGRVDGDKADEGRRKNKRVVSRRREGLPVRK